MNDKSEKKGSWIRHNQMKKQFSNEISNYNRG